MSSLQCPARVLLAHPGEAAYEPGGTDLDGSLTALGRRQARELGERLRAERVARVWTSPLARAVQAAEIAATVLGVDDVVVREALRGYGDRPLTGGAEATTAARVRAVLEEVADGHRGEAVLVVTHGGVIRVTVPVLLGLARSATAGLTLEPATALELEADADGWRRPAASS